MRGTRLGPFVLDELLGQGGMGQVWSATHVGQDLPVAIKIMQGDLTLGLLRSVTLHAVRLEKRHCYRLKAPPSLRRCVKLQGTAQQGNQRQPPEYHTLRNCLIGPV